MTFKNIIEEKTLINEFVYALSTKCASIFVGAGMSKDSTDIDWKKLIEPYANDLGFDDNDYPFIAQAYVNKHENLLEFKQEICDKFKIGNPTEFHKLIARLPIKNYWTTNYDKLIEKAFVKNVPEVISDNNHFVYNQGNNRDHIIYKCHGDCDNAKSIIITQEDYENYKLNSFNFMTSLYSELAASTVLFVGYSFRDPDINGIISNLQAVNKIPRKHLLITKRENGENENKQLHWINNIARYGIKTVLIDDYPSIMKIMESIEKKYMASQIFISGSAAEYKSFETEKDAHDFIKQLGYQLIKYDCACSNQRNGLRIINGNGFGVGPYLYDGIAEAAGTWDLDMADYLLMYPFPEIYYSQFEKEKTIEEKYIAYREKMIDKCGIAFFIFGNKKNPNTNEIINADGVRKEFEIAKAKHKYVFPIGATGYMAKQLADETIANFEKYNGDMPYVKDIYLRMNKSGISAEEIINCMIQIIDTLAYRDDIK